MADILTKLLLNTGDFDAKLSNAKKGVDNMGSSFTSAGKTAVAGFTAIAGAVGIAAGGLATFNSVIGSSQTISDKWEATCRSARSAVDEFFYSLGSGDFTFFSAGLDEIISKAQIAAGALDQLGNTTMSYGYFTTKNQAEFTEAITTLRDKNATTGDRDAAMATVNRVMGDQSEISAQLRRRVTESMQALVTESNSLKGGDVSLFDVERVFRLDVSAMGDAEKGKLKQLYEEYKKAAIDARDRFSTEIMTMDGADISIDEEALSQEMSKINAQYQDAILYNTILVKESDDWLRNLMFIMGQADNADRLVASWRKALNRASQSPLAGATKPSGSAPTSGGAIPLTIDTAPAAGSIDWVEAHIKALRDELNAAATPDERVWIAEQMDFFNTMKSQLDTEFAALSIGPAAGSIDFISEQISAAQQAMSAATTDEARRAAAEVIKELENQKIILTIEANYGPISGMSMDEKIKLNVPTPEVNAYRQSLASADRQQRKMQESTGEISSVFGAFGQTMSSVSSMTNEGSAQWLTWGANVSSAIAAAIPQIVALTNANVASAVSGAMASVSSIPWVGWTLTGLAAAGVIAAMASVPKYADGGIVGGSSYFGDKIIAAVNSGEVILNGKQQRNLVGMMAGGSGPSTVNVTGTFRMRGRDMVALIDKENRIKERTR